MFNHQLYGALIVSDLVSLACYAFILVAAILFRLGPAYEHLVTVSALRLTRPPNQFKLGIWGLAITVAVPFIAAMLFKTKILGILGLAMIPLASILLGLSYAVAARFIENSSVQTSNRIPPFAAPFLIAMASALPVLGWLVLICCVLPSLGATAEYILSGEYKNRPQFSAINSENEGEIVGIVKSESSEKVV